LVWRSVAIPGDLFAAGMPQLLRRCKNSKNLNTKLNYFQLDVQYFAVAEKHIEKEIFLLFLCNFPQVVRFTNHNSRFTKKIVSLRRFLIATINYSIHI
jgi:hypothetical protein